MKEKFIPILSLPPPTSKEIIQMTMPQQPQVNVNISQPPLPPQQPPPTFSVKNPVCPYLLFLSFTLCSPQPYTGYCRTNTFRSPNCAKLPYDPSCTPADRPVIKPFREFPIFPAKQPCRRGIKYSNLYSSSASSLSRNRVTAPASSGEGDHGATFPGVNGAKGPCFTS